MNDEAWETLGSSTIIARIEEGWVLNFILILH